MTRVVAPAAARVLAAAYPALPPPKITTSAVSAFMARSLAKPRGADKSITLIREVSFLPFFKETLQATRQPGRFS